jgi:methionyl-tRNA synthetase
MASGSRERTRANQLQNRAASSVVSLDSSCARCGGLLVDDFSMELPDSTGELEGTAKRCVQCGEVVDPVIRRNRRIRQESITVRHAETIFAEMLSQPEHF